MSEQVQENQQNKYAGLEVIPGIDYVELDTKLAKLAELRRTNPPKCQADEMNMIVEVLSPTEIVYLYTARNAQFNKVSGELKYLKNIIGEAIIARNEMMEGMIEEEPKIIVPENKIIM